MISSVTILKILFTLIVILSDLILYLIPFVFENALNWQSKLNYINALFGGILMTISFVSLLSDATIETTIYWSDWPLIFIIFSSGILFSCIAPRWLKLLRNKIHENKNIQEIESKFQLENTIVELNSMKRDEINKMIHLKRIKPNPNYIGKNDNNIKYQNLQEDNKEEFIDEEEELMETSNLFVFILVSFFESFLSMIVIGFQNTRQHIALLSILTILGDSIQMIIIGMSMKQYKDLKQEILTRNQLYTPIILIIIFIFVSNISGMITGYFIISIIDFESNKVLFVVISECLMAFNSGIFTKISLVDMIHVELNKIRDSNKTIFLKFFFIFIGSIIGIFLSLLIRDLQS